jgi:hypothetical protein
MIVHIEQKELRRGLWGSDMSRVEVSVAVDFTEEETLIIKARRLEDHVVLERGPDVRLAEKIGPEESKRWEGRFDLRIGALVGRKADAYICGSPAHAKVYAERLGDALRILKLFILENGAVGHPRAFEI